MGKKVKELVTYWGPAISEWGDGTEKRYEIDRDEDLAPVDQSENVILDRLALRKGHCHVKRSDFDRLFSVACRDANHLLHTPSIST